MAYDLQDAEASKEYLENLHIEFKFQCYSEKRPDGCHRLADFYEATQQNFKDAARVLKMNCDEHNFGHSCFKYGNYSMLGRGLEKKDEKEACKYYKKACDQGYTTGCHNYGLLLGSGRGTGQKDWKGAAEVFSKNCDKDYVDSCYFLSAMYITGKDGVAKDLKKAFQISQKACDLGSTAACMNLSIMYKKGDGCNKNMKLSKRFQEMAVKMNEENRNPEMHLEFGK